VTGDEKNGNTYVSNGGRDQAEVDLPYIRVILPILTGNRGAGNRIPQIENPCRMKAW